ncbi:MAG TPA: NAD(P)H-binding protein [Streptosporangiaceae bacterium]|nr:NAD(P)H-binding protein [Streptosporangiaceae bacterium]
MPASILVTGGTGRLGRHLVPLLRDAGHQVRVLSRNARADSGGVEYVTGDLVTSAGIDAAADGAEIIVHCAAATKPADDQAQTTNLIKAASKTRPRHLVYISVVGADRVPVVSGVDRAMFGYFSSKLASERAVAESGMPWTTLRATQFHELIEIVGRFMARLPLMPVPAGFRFQPVDSGDVAARLAELTLGDPAGLAPDLGGPRIYDVPELLRGYLRAAGKQRPMVPLWLPGKAARAIRAGANLAPDHADGHRTWEEYLAGLPASQRPDESFGSTGAG